MKITEKNGDIFVTPVECFDLDLTLDCGQAFRWKKNEDGSYTGVAKNHPLTLKKEGDTLILKIPTRIFLTPFGKIILIWTEITKKSATS